MQYPYSLSVVYPAFNEESALESTIGRSMEALAKYVEDFEIIVVNDCSTDSTNAKLLELRKQFAGRLRVIDNERNLGQGKSILKGFAAANKDLVMHNAIDYPFDLEDLPKLLDSMNRADVVVAVRKNRGAYNAYRKFISHINIYLLRMLFNPKLNDYNFIQVYRRQVLSKMEVGATSTGFVTPEILIRAYHLGFKIVEVDIDYHPRLSGVARSGSPLVLARSFFDLFKFWLRMQQELMRSASRYQSLTRLQHMNKRQEETKADLVERH